jgi:hypothetical protein
VFFISCILGAISATDGVWILFESVSACMGYL